MTEYNRDFNVARQSQGFKSQADLDAFFAYIDHTEQCPECQKPGKGVLVDDGYQPTANRCDRANELWVAWCAIHDHV